MADIENLKKAGYQRYDFDRPDKFTHDNLNSLESIANVFGRNFSQNFSAFLRLPIELQFVSIEQVPFGSEYLEKMPRDEYVFCSVNVGEKDQMLLEFELGMVMSILRKTLGGSIGEISKVQKNITEIEKISVKHWINEHLFKQLREAFQNIAEFSFSIDELETDPQYAKVTVPTDMIALITFDVYLGTEKTRMRMCIPFLTIEPIQDKLTTENVQYKEGETSEEQQTYLVEHVGRMEQALEVELGRTKGTLKQLMDLQEGNFIVLDSYEKPLIGYVKGKPIFECAPGKVEKKKGVVILGTTFKEGGNEDE